MTALSRRVEDALAEILHDGATITATAVAERSGISRATIYRHPELIDVIRDHRARGANADTLTELSTRIAQLHIIIEALAARVRQQEERLRQLEAPRRTATRA